MIHSATRASSSGEVVVTGDVILTQGQNVLTGGRLVYNVNTEAARMEGAPRGAAVTTWEFASIDSIIRPF